MPVILDSSEIKVIDGDKNFTIETVKSNVIVNQDTEINEPTITPPDVYVVKTAPITEDYPVLEADATNLVAWYKFDDDLTNSVVGSSIGTLTTTNTPATFINTDGNFNFGKSALVNNTTLSIPNFHFENLTQGETKSFTVSFWFKANTISGTWNVLFDASNYPTTAGIRVYINSNNYLYIYYYNSSSSSDYTLASNGNFTDNNWRLYTFVWSYVSNSSDVYTYDLRFYENSVLNGGVDRQIIKSDNANGFQIGDGNPDGLYPNEGYYDDFRIYDKALSAEEIDSLYNDKVKLEITPVPLQQYTEERMYPPTRDLASASHLISGESYGNGVYEVSESDGTYDPSKTGFSAFNTSMSDRVHFNNKYTNGVYNGSDYIVPGYLGDWIKIKLPRPIKLTKYGFKQRTTLQRAPGKYKLYGSNDGTNWDVLVHKRTTVSYTQQISVANDYFEENINVNNQYQYFGLVANQLNGNEQILNFDEWYIYGKEFISEEPEYKLLTFEHEAVEDLLIDFEPYNTQSTWTNYINSLQTDGFVQSYDLNYILNPGYTNAVFKSNVAIGYIDFIIPSGYDSCDITYGREGSDDPAQLKINDIDVDSTNENLKTYTATNLVSGQIIRIYENHGQINRKIKLIYYNTQTEYTVNFPAETECDILIVGGGGGGGGVEEPATSGSGGGGGGGGVIFLQNQTISTGSYIIKVGKGGKGYDIADSTRQTGERGYNSSFNYIQTEAIGGGGGGTRGISFLSQGLEGGSGGGSSHTNGSTDTPGGLGTVVNLLKADGTVLIENYRQGYNGGTTVYESPYSGGGGGAGGNGFGSADTPDDSAGGIGRAEENGVDFKTYFNIASGIGEHHTDSKVYFAGGGASGYRSNDANHSNGGLGGGGSSSNGPSENGVANTGGGGGGARSGTAGTIQTGGNGGSGIVIIRYKTQYQATTHGAQWTYHSANPNTHHYGNVGIGTTASATQKLLVNGDMNVTGNYKQNDNTIGNWYKGGTSIYRASGNVGIGNTDPRYSLHVHGGVYAGEGGTTGDGTTVWTSTSDSRMKDNIFKASYKECYDIFKKIELYRYNFKPGHVNSNDRNQLGFIAQEVQQQIPNSVEPRSIRLSSGVYIHDILTLNVTQINYILYGTFKYLIAELDIIKKHLESQEEAGQTE